jgi:hypothetical protein
MKSFDRETRDKLAYCFFFNTALLCSSFEMAEANFCNSPYRAGGSVNSRTVYVRV